MFEDFGPANTPLPPAGALEQAMSRGRKIRRQRRAAIISGVALSAALIGGLVLVNPLQSNQSLVVPAEKPTPTSTPLPAPTHLPADYSPIPVSPATTGAAKYLDFGTLTKITTTDGVVTLHVNRSKFYMGDEAAAKNGGKAPFDDFLIQDTDGDKEYTFTLDPKASIQAEGSLQDNMENTNTRVNLTLSHFVTNMTKLDGLNAVESDTNENIHIYVWLRHTDGPDGPVTALADQFIT